MGRVIPANIPVVDFRRQSMVLQWDALGGTWTACDVPPALVHGVALIRASHPNICIFGRDDRLHLQIAADRYEMSDNSPRVKWGRDWASLGVRRRFVIETATGGALLSHAYWNGQGDDFFSWLAARTADPQWRAANARRWSEGVEPATLRAC